MFGMLGRAALGAAMLALALSGQAWASPFEPAAPGTRLYMSSGGYLEIDSADGTTVRTVNANYSSQAWYGMCAAPSADQRFNASALHQLWPLAAGKSVSLEAEQKDRRWQWNFTVVGRAPVATALGKSDTWLIEFRSTGLTHDYEAKTSCWYDPAIGFPVKRKIEILRGQGNASEWQVIRIERRDFTKRVEFEAPPLGTIFTTTQGHAYTVTGTRNNAILAHSGGREYSFVGGLMRFVPDQITEERELGAAPLWPLEPGKRHRIEGGRGLVVFVHDTTAEARETITVPAGTFSAYRIRWVERSIGARSPELVYTIWYAPSLRFPIKQVIQQDGVARSAWELRSITRPKVAEAPRN